MGIVKAAINGVRGGDYHPRLPFSAAEAAAESVACVAAGAAAIHVHVWRGDRESLHAEDVAAFVSAVREELPYIPLGISSGAWIVPDSDERVRQVAAWEVVPDFVSLNFDEAGAEAVADVLLEKQIGIEAGLANGEAARRFARWPHRERCLRVLLEPRETEIEAAVATVTEMEAIVEAAAPPLPRLLHGFDAAVWPLVRLAARRGYDTRIGFEDSKFLPDGTAAEENAELVRAAIAIMNFEGAKPAG